MKIRGPEDFAQAQSVLAHMAMALMSGDPALHQIVVQSRPEPEVGSRVGALTEGLIVVDEDGRIAGLNEAAEALFDVAEKNLLGAPAASLFAGEAAAITVTEDPGTGRRSLVLGPDLRAKRRSGPAPALDLRQGEMRIDGRRRFLLRVSPLGEQRRADDPARRTEARYRALIEQIPAVTFMAALDEGENDMYVSPQIEALLGFSQKEWLDDPVLWFKRLHPDDQDLWNEEFSRGIAAGGPFRAECRVIARDGRTVWILGEARVVRDDAGHPLFLQGIVFDITETKRAEQQLRDMQETKIRTERLAAVGRLAAGIGHDIRNPLAAIGNAHYFVAKKVAASALAEDKRVTQFLDVIDKELRVCVRIVSDLLDYARERPPSLVACPLGPLVNDALGVVPPLPNVTLRNEVPDTLPVPDLDQDQFRQLLVNLIQNAAEAIPRDRPGVVRVSAEASAAEILLSISDDGAGIPEENLDKIFEPLFTSKVKGTGLGLSIVSNIITRHGGTIQVKSRKNVGTTFTVHLPRR